MTWKTLNWTIEPLANIFCSNYCYYIIWTFPHDHTLSTGKVMDILNHLREHKPSQTNQATSLNNLKILSVENDS